MTHAAGVKLSDDGAWFRVWAPSPQRVELWLPEASQAVPMQKNGEFWEAFVPPARAGTRYCYRLNGTDNRGDPRSMFQPEGVHGPSEVIDHNFARTDAEWNGIPLSSHVIYEMHVGTYTPAGTFDGVIPHLTALKELGVTAIELMPIAEFPGQRNWGYDGVFPYAVQRSYGGPAGLKKLVNAAHSLGLAVILDVVYNHLGPEGNYFAQFAPYFTDCYKTPWGDAVNFDGAYSDPVRDYFLENAAYWIKDFHIDGLRLDACHEIYDNSPIHFLRELETTVKCVAREAGRQVHLFAESDANDVKYLRRQEKCGYGLDCQWLDDFHHSLYTQIPEADCERYLPDYENLDFLAKAYDKGFVYSGQYSPFRKRRHGTDSGSLAGSKFVVFIQNHDQIGNKLKGTRLASEVSSEALKLAAGANILSPYIPLLFMGEEYKETAPFLYFTDHSDVHLVEAVREGRKIEFADASAADEIPDPQARESFDSSVLNHDSAANPENRALWLFYQELLRLRRDTPALACLDKQNQEAHRAPNLKCLLIRRQCNSGRALLILNLSKDRASVPVPAEGSWTLALDSADGKWRGPGSEAETGLVVEPTSLSTVTLQPESIVLYISP